MESSKVCPLLYNVKRSEIDGPLLQFQVTVYKKEDVLKLMSSLNNSCTEQILPEDRLNNTFELWWPKLEEALQIKDTDIIQHGVNSESNNAHNDAILEEILSLIQTQQKILRRPEELLPPEYLIDLMRKSNGNKSLRSIDSEVYHDLFEGYNRLRAATIDNLNLLRSIEETNEDCLMNAKNIVKLCDILEKPIYFIQRRAPRHKQPDILTNYE